MPDPNALLALCGWNWTACVAAGVAGAPNGDDGTCGVAAAAEVAGNVWNGDTSDFVVFEDVPWSPMIDAVGVVAFDNDPNDALTAFCGSPPAVALVELSATPSPIFNPKLNAFFSFASSSTGAAVD